MAVFEVSTKRKGDIRVLQVRGKVTSETEEAFLQALQDLDVEDVPHLLLDLDEVEYVNSIGMGAIIRCLRKRRAGGGRMAVVCACEALLRAFHVLHFDSVLPLRATMPEAVAFLRRDGDTTKGMKAS